MQEGYARTEALRLTNRGTSRPAGPGACMVLSSSVAKAELNDGTLNTKQISKMSALRMYIPYPYFVTFSHYLSNVTFGRRISIFIWISRATLHGDMPCVPSLQTRDEIKQISIKIPGKSNTLT